jgi:hypothetical protein
MRVIAVVLFAVSVHAANLPYFSVLADDPGAWTEILSGVGFQRQPAGIFPRLHRPPPMPPPVPNGPRVERGSIPILEGESCLADL